MVASPRFVAYYRVSTQQQGRSGLGLDAQRQDVARYLAGCGGRLVGEFKEVESGKRKDRPQLAAALAHCRVTGARLIIAKLDRLARNVAFVSALMESGADFVAVDVPSASRVVLHLLAAIAEEESRAASARTKAALAAAKSSGKRLGTRRNLRPGLGQRQATQAAAELARRRCDDVLPILTELQAEGHSGIRELARELNRRGIAAPRGGQWHAATVARLMGA